MARSCGRSMAIGDESGAQKCCKGCQIWDEGAKSTVRVAKNALMHQVQARSAGAASATCWAIGTVNLVRGRVSAWPCMAREVLDPRSYDPDALWCAGGRWSPGEWRIRLCAARTRCRARKDHEVCGLTHVVQSVLLSTTAPRSGSDSIGVLLAFRRNV